MKHVFNVLAGRPKPTHKHAQKPEASPEASPEVASARQPRVSVSAAAIFLHEVLTRKSIKIYSFCMKTHEFSVVFEEQREIPESGKNMRGFVPPHE